MVDVFEQVEEELRSERYKRLARTWLPIGAGVGAIALISALGWWGYQSWQTSEADKASVAYQRGIEAFASGNMDQANTAFGEAADTASRGYKALALMQQAGIAVEQGKNDEAVRLFDEAAKAGRDPIIADGAALKAAYLLVDKGSLEDMTKRLEPLTGEKRPYRALAQEALATVQLLNNKTVEARETFVQLQLGQDVPQTVRQRAVVAVQLIDSGTHGAVRKIVDEAAKLPAQPQAVAPAAAPAAPAEAAPAAPAQAQPAQAQ
ncbi:tetratricopeptide repeat protein [Brevundimonas sp.]|uniref:tetratricopeptide repeat protein n=2 Tax=Brevundimonas sp. TaxID=1871086 RepID=UPI002FCB6137